MPSVKVTFLSFLAKITGEKDADIDIELGITIEHLLGILASRYGEDFEERVYSTTGELNRFVMIMVNGIDMRALNGLDTTLEPDSEIQMLPAIAGG